MRVNADSHISTDTGTTSSEVRIQPPQNSGGKGWTETAGNNEWLSMAFGGKWGSSTNAGAEARMQRLERGQKITRRGRVIVSVPQFNSQTVISQTSGNNPFVTNIVSGAQFPAGQVPDQVAPTTNNSNIRFPRTVDQS